MKGLIIVAENFQDEEFVYPYYFLQRICQKVDVASVDGLTRYGKYGVPARVNKTFSSCLSSDFYDVLLIPGGFECPDRLRIIPEVLELVDKHHRSGKLIAAICHAPWVLISALDLTGKNITGFKAIRDDLRNAGANYKEVNVVVDQNIITSPHYNQNPEFMDAVANFLAK